MKGVPLQYKEMREEFKQPKRKETPWDQELGKKDPII